MTEKRQLPQLESIQRISRIPVVETGVNIAFGLYGKVKNSNPLMRWYLNKIEGSVNLAIDTTLIAGPLLEVPLTVVDTIVCKGLDTVQQRVPVINYPPEKIINKTKDYVSANIVQPVVKRAESVKEFSVHEATKYGEIAATHIDTALNVADQYVDKYLPDATDTSEGKAPERNGDSKAIQTIDHVNRLSRKLQRRLTKRTIAEARALRRQGTDALYVLMKLAELMVKDPKQFAAKMKALWAHLSQDEPENQVPPANLEQLIGLLTRETARRIVHLTNFSFKTAAQLPSYTVHTIQLTIHHTNVLLDRILKTIHLEGVKAFAVARAEAQIHYLNVTLRDVQVLIENLLSSLLGNQKYRTGTQEKPIPLHTLSPVAQSPERTPENSTAAQVEQNASNHNKNQPAQQKPVKEKRKSKQVNNTSDQQRTEKAEDKPTQSNDLNNYCKPNGDTSKNTNQ